MVHFRITRGEEILETEFSPCASILQLKVALEEVLKRKDAGQTLMFCGNVIEAAHIFETYDCEEGYATVELIPGDETEEPKFKINVKSSFSEVQAEVKGTDTVEDLRKQLATIWQIPDNSMILVCGGKEMSDELPLSHYNLFAGSIVEVIVLVETP